MTIVETACLLHDTGNPPFGHFGEIAISDWFQRKSTCIKPKDINGKIEDHWTKHYKDFKNFDGNPQGFRIVCKLQAKADGDLCGMNLTASTLAASMKYPWSTELIDSNSPKKKPGYFQTEKDVVDWVWGKLKLEEAQKHPLVYLMEAADDIAYCLSDIEDGYEKGLIRYSEFARYLRKIIKELLQTASDDTDIKELKEMEGALCHLEGIEHEEQSVCSKSFDAMEDFRSGFVRYFTRHAGKQYRKFHSDRSPEQWSPLLKETIGYELLKSVKTFVKNRLYTSTVVRNRELTAHAVLSGLLNAYKNLMTCNKDRFVAAIHGETEDKKGCKITEQSLVSLIPKKYMAVYEEEVRRLSDEPGSENGMVDVLEKIYRIRLIIDFIAGMTDAYALQTFKLISGIHTGKC